ncbi:MAG: hypothetical protein AAGE52_05205 [Myxococcota bacterium]
MGRVAWTALCASILILGCSSNDGPPADAGGGTDSGGEVDAGIDSGGEVDAGVDAGEDAAVATDSGTDAETDSGVDSGTDAGIDSTVGIDACVPPPCPAPPPGCRYEVTDPCTCGELVCEGTPCTDDSECVGGFCRDTMTPDMRACHPYAEEGESCGGFTLPWAVERCNPEVHTCLGSSPLIADAPGVCLLPVTVADLRSMPARYEGRVVGIRTSFVTNGLTFCTEIACPPEMPCCNGCGSGMIAKDNAADESGVDLADMAGTDYMCSGNECMPTETCTVDANAEYRIIGTFTGGKLRVRSIQRTSFGP